MQDYIYQDPKKKSARKLHGVKSNNYEPNHTSAEQRIAMARWKWHHRGHRRGRRELTGGGLAEDGHQHHHGCGAVQRTQSKPRTSLDYHCVRGTEGHGYPSNNWSKLREEASAAVYNQWWGHHWPEIQSWEGHTHVTNRQTNRKAIYVCSSH